MSLYARQPSGALVQLKEVTPGPELYEEEIERLVWENLELVAGEPLFQLRRQATLPGGGLPDILALDSLGRVVVIEVKRDIDRRQLAQALEYAGWARTTSLDDLATYYHRGADAFFSDWPRFTDTAIPVVVNRTPRVVLIARSVHPRTTDALHFLADNALPIDVVTVSVYEDAGGRRLFDIGGPELSGALPAEQARPEARRQRSFMIDGHAVRLSDLVSGGLLDPGTELTLTSTEGEALGIVTEDGNLRVGDSAYATPSAAGVGAVGHPVDGWVKWRVPSRGGQSLADLRNTLIERANQPDDSVNDA